MGTIPTEIKEKIQKELFSEALPMLEEFVSGEGRQSQMAFTILANCAIQLKMSAKAAAALEKALSFPSPPSANVQKMWKTLSDLYEELQIWDKFATASIKLYDINKSKGNFDRCIQLAEQISAAYLKANNGDQAVGFVLSHLENRAEFQVTATHVWSLVARASELQRVLLAKGQGQGQSQGLGATSQSKAVLLASEGSAGFSSDSAAATAVISATSAGPLAALVYETISDGSSGVCPTKLSEMWASEVAQDLASLLCRHESEQRPSCDNETIADGKVDASSHLWLACFNRCVQLCQLLVLAPSSVKANCFPGAFNNLFDAWVCSGMNLVDGLLPFADEVLVLDSNSLEAHCLRCWSFLRTGHLQSCRNTAKVLQDTWNLFGVSDENSSACDIYSVSSITLSTATFVSFAVGVIVAALDNFRYVRPKVILHATFVLLRSQLQFRKRFGVLCPESLNESIRLARIRGMLHLQQHTVAATEALKMLPQYFRSSAVASSDACEALVSVSDVSDEAGDLPRPETDQEQVQTGTLVIANMDAIAGKINSQQQCSFSWCIFHFLLSILIDFQSYSCVEQITNSLAMNPSFSPSGSLLSTFIASFQAINMLWRHISEKRSQKMKDSKVCYFIGGNSLLNISIGDVNAAAVVRTLHQQLKISSSSVWGVEIDSFIRYHMGLAMWSAGPASNLRKDKNGCIAYLLAAAKSDPGYGDAFALIGHYYFLELQDFDRAVKCYERSLACNALSIEAGFGLSDVYFRSNNVVSSLQLWGRYSRGPHASWWSLVLEGRFCLSVERFEDAALLFQKAVEYDASDASTWQCLGIAYDAMNKSSAALKAMQVAESLCPSDLYLQCSIAQIEQKMLQFRCARERFKRVITMAATAGAGVCELVLHKSLAETHLMLGHENVVFGNTAAAARSVAEGIATINAFVCKALGSVDAAFLEADHRTVMEFHPIWKLLGDLHLFSASLPMADVGVLCLNQHSTIAPVDIVLDQLRLAEKFYRHFLSILVRCLESSDNSVDRHAVQNKVACAWYDVGVSIYYQAVVRIRQRGQGSGLVSTRTILHSDPDVERELSRSQEVFKSGLAAYPLHSGCWNGLGMCNFSNSLVSKSCFVRATQIDSNAAAYANLGQLYAAAGQASNARSCFSTLQLSGDNPTVWISIAYLMEQQLGCHIAEQKFGLQISNCSGVAGHAGPYDAFIAASDISKPPDAALGAALSWLRRKGLCRGNYYLTSPWMTGAEADAGSCMQPCEVDGIELRYEVESKLQYFLKYRPTNVFAWIVLAFSLEIRNQYTAAILALEKSIICLHKAAETFLSSSNSQEFSLSEDDTLSAVQHRFDLCLQTIYVAHRRCSFKNLTLSAGGKCEDVEASFLLPLCHLAEGSVLFRLMHGFRSLSDYSSWLERVLPVGWIAEGVAVTGLSEASVELDESHIRLQMIAISRLISLGVFKLKLGDCCGSLELLKTAWSLVNELDRCRSRVLDSGRSPRLCKLTDAVCDHLLFAWMQAAQLSWTIATSTSYHSIAGGASSFKSSLEECLLSVAQKVAESIDEAANKCDCYRVGLTQHTPFIISYLCSQLNSLLSESNKVKLLKFGVRNFDNNLLLSVLLAEALCKSDPGRAVTALLAVLKRYQQVQSLALEDEVENEEALSLLRSNAMTDAIANSNTIFCRAVVCLHQVSFQVGGYSLDDTVSSVCKSIPECLGDFESVSESDLASRTLRKLLLRALHVQPWCEAIVDILKL